MEGQIMNSAERVFAALERQIPDRIPVMEMIIDPNVIDKLNFENYFDLVDGLGLDAVMLNAANLTRHTTFRKEPFKNDWGVTLRYTNEIVPIPVDHPVKTPEAFKHFVPPNPKENGLLKLIPEVVKRYKGKKAIVVSSREVFGNS
jgi:uroporphyrinogen decarboxylase